MEIESLPKRAVFVHHWPENRILVENTEDGVVIHATRNNFSLRRKQVFIRELAAEGFIPDGLQWLSSSETQELPGVIWIIDDSWDPHNTATRGMSGKVMVRILLSAAVLWLALMALVLGGVL
jgi:hypothetical protein